MHKTLVYNCLLKKQHEKKSFFSFFVPIEMSSFWLKKGEIC